MAALAFAAFLLIVLSGILLFGTGRPRLTLAASLGRIFPPASAGRITLWGVVLPAAVWWVLVYLTPAGARDAGIDHYEFEFIGHGSGDFTLWPLQILSGCLLVLMALHIAVRRELCRRAACLSFGPVRAGVRLMDGVLTGLVLLSITVPLISLFRPDWDPFVPPLVLALQAFPILRLIWCLFGAIGKQRESMVANVITNRRFLAPLTVLCALLLASIPLLKIRERTALEGDPLAAASPTAAAYRAQDLSRRLAAVREFLSSAP